MEITVAKLEKKKMRTVYETSDSLIFRIITGVPEGEEEHKGPEKVFEETIAENFCNMGKEAITYVQAELRVPYRVIPQKKAQGHIVMNCSRDLYTFIKDSYPSTFFMDGFLRSIYPDWGYVMVHLSGIFEPIFSPTIVS